MSDSRHTRGRRKRSLAKLFEATSIWAIVAIAVGWLVYKEISQKTLQIEQAKAGRKLIIDTSHLHGITANSLLICQGLTVGKIENIEALPGEEDPEELTIAIHAQLDARYSDWRFAPEAEVSTPGLAGGLTGTSITLAFAGIRDEEAAIDPPDDGEPQTITLQAPEDTGARLRNLLGEAETVIGAFTEEVTPPEGWPEDQPATRIDVLTANLASASEALSGASEKLEMQMDPESDESLMAGMHRIEDDLGKFMVNSNELITEIRATVASIDSRFDDTLGASKSERAALRKEAEEVLSSLDTFIDRLDDLTARTGDTFIGRALIRKPDSGEAQAPQPASTESSRTRRTYHPGKRR